MQHFTERFKGRLVEMAVGEPDVPVRNQAIGVLRSVDRHGLLEIDQRDALACLVFHEDGRVRRAAAPFVTTLLQESFLEQRVELDSTTDKRRGRKKGDRQVAPDLEQDLRLKCLASLLSRQGSLLKANAERADQPEEAGQPLGQSTWRPALASLGRTALVVASLWDEEDSLRDWQRILDFLLSDRTAASNEAVDENAVSAAFELTEAEESTLLEVLVASVQRSRSIENEDGTQATEITRSMMTALPKLLAKYQGDASRLTDVLLIIQSLQPGLYLELRKVTVSYASALGLVNRPLRSNVTGLRGPVGRHQSAALADH